MLFIPYIGTKRLSAAPISLGEYNNYRQWDIPEDENPDKRGFLVEYHDGGEGNDIRHEGYISWSPEDVFKAAYQPVTAMNFGHALEMLKTGARVARKGWNGQGMFVYLVPAASYPAQTGAAKGYFGEGALVPYRAYLALKTVDEDVATWVPSVSDILADDWSVVH